MNTKIAPLVHSCSFTIKGKEKFCLFCKDLVNGYLPIGSIMLYILPSIRFLITRDKKSLVPGAFDVEYIVSDIVLGELYDSVFKERKNIFLDQEQITATIESFEEAILPKPYLSILGHFCAIFFFQENKRIFVAEFKTSALGNECEVYELNQQSREKVIRKQHTTLNRVIFPR